MKNTRARSFVVYLLSIFFLLGLGFFVFSYFKDGRDWVAHPGNQHLSQDGQLLSAGKIFDRNGVVLAETSDGARIYHQDIATRRALLHTIGDNTRFISTAVQNVWRSELIGYNPLTGISLNSAGRTGNDLTLTIHSSACRIAQELFGGRKGAISVYNYKTGELLCMVSSPNYDPQNRPNIEEDETGAYDGVYLNRVLSSSYTPGSVFKVITAAAAIENIPNLYERTFTCPGYVEVEGEKITCMSQHGEINFEDGFAQSCNVVFAELALELGKEKMTATAEKMGFGDSFTIDRIPTAKSSYDVSEADAVDLGWSGIGQYTDLVNPAHLMILMGAVANGGVPVEPYLVEKVTTPIGLPLQYGSAGSGERLCSASTAEKLTGLMRHAVTTNYGEALFPGLTVCAKTGTAEVGNGQNPHAWMIGFTLDEDCPLAFSCVVENSGHGFPVAGPILAGVLEELAQDMRGE